MSDEKKKKGKRTAVRLVIDLLTVVCLIVAGYSIYQIAKQKSEDSQGESLYENMAEQAVQEETKEVEVPLKKNREPVKIQMKSIDFEELWALNEDVVAWLELPGTIINYPVAQGKDNNEYLRTLLDGTHHRFGTLFIDYRNEKDFSDENTIIYGHNIKAGDMFSILKNYREQSYYDEHPYFLLYTPEKTYILEIFAGKVVDANNAIPMTFETKEEYQEYLNHLVEKSTFQSDVTVTSDDRIVTLYTCASDFDDARYVLCGRLTEITD